jgi:hypothetical protein
VGLRGCSHAPGALQKLRGASLETCSTLAFGVMGALRGVKPSKGAQQGQPQVRKVLTEGAGAQEVLRAGCGNRSPPPMAAPFSICPVPSPLPGERIGTPI